jgi:flagellar biogenesis protein FliO
MKRETELRFGAVNFMETAVLRVSSSPFGRRFIAMWERILRLSRRAPKRLRLCESLPLGERRFVAVVEFEQTRFLVGGTPSSLVLLSRLQDASGRAENESGETSRQATAAVTKPRGEIV